MANIKFSDDAIKDLQQTKAYITKELCNEQAANSTISKIMKNIQILETFPESGTLLETKVKFNTNYRFLVCGNYTAFYRIENNEVYVVRILYGRRDFMRILFKSQDEN